MYGLGVWVGSPPEGPYVDHGIVLKQYEDYARRIESLGSKCRGLVCTEPNALYDIDVRIDEVLLDLEGRL